VSKTLFILAGPEGVGKTTYAARHIRAVTGGVAFVNLDEIARGLSPFDVEAERVAAARIALDRIRRRLDDGDGPFTIETTLAGRSYLPMLERADRLGWRTELFYFIVRDVSVALQRVARRISEGGHAVPEADVRRRFERSLSNLPAYVRRVHGWRVFANDGAPPRTLAEGVRGCRSFLAEGEIRPAALGAFLRGLPVCAPPSPDLTGDGA
jgi:predicted ABC-type ATPase